MKRAAKLACNIFIAVMAFVAFGMMLSNTGPKMLEVYGLENLKFYTVLSNLLLAVISIAYAAFLIAKRREGGIRIPLALQVAKLIGVTATTLTFLTVMLFLGPLYGHAAMLQNANFWFHLVLPVLAIIEFAFLDEGPRLKVRHTFIAVIPTIAYGTFYLANILINGMGEGAHTNDWYGFAAWGIPAGVGIFAIITVVSWLIALALRAANNTLANPKGRRGSTCAA